MILAQSFIVIGYLIFFASRFRDGKKNMLVTDTISRICFILGYCLSSSINGIEHTIYGIIRNIVGQLLINKNKTVKNFNFIFMAMVLFIMYGISFNGISTVMLMLSGIINLFTAIFTKEQGMRLGTVSASICNIIAFSLMGSYASIVGEMLCGLIGILSYKKGSRL